MSNQIDLNSIRTELQEIDKQILELFSRRQSLSEDVFRAKYGTGKPIYDAEQEARKLAALENAEDSATRLWGKSIQTTLMRLSRAKQYSLSRPISMDWELGKAIQEGKRQEPPVRVVATQGNAYSYSAKAATILFPDRAYLPHKTFEEAILSVVRGNSDAAVLPLENSTAGTVDDVYQLLQSTQLFISNTLNLSVKHRLLVKPGTRINEIRSISSHKQALAQCAGKIKEHGWRTIEALNTAFAAQDVAQGDDASCAAIATASAAEAYGLEVLDDAISDVPENQTRFIVARKHLYVHPEANTLSLLVRLSHSAGSLVAAMNLFSDYGINLTKIQSSPIPRNPWEYYFYIDCEVRPNQKEVLDVLYQLQHESVELRILGWYKSGL